LVFGLLLLRFSQENGAPQAFSKQVSGSSGRPHFSKTESQSLGRQDVSKRRALVGLRQRLIAIKIWSVKYGRKWRWVGYPSFTDLAFAEKCHLLNSSKNVGPAVVLLGGFLGSLGIVG